MSSELSRLAPFPSYLSLRTAHEFLSLDLFFYSKKKRKKKHFSFYLPSEFLFILCFRLCPVVGKMANTTLLYLLLTFVPLPVIRS